MIAADLPKIPHVGIFWSITPGGGRPELLIDSVPIAAGEDYGECINHGAHADYWSKLATMDDLALRERLLPNIVRWTEYDAWPRGRVVFHRPTGRFWLYADRRLQNPAMVTDLLRRFGLPADQTDIRSDAHYRPSA